MRIGDANPLRTLMSVSGSMVKKLGFMNAATSLAGKVTVYIRIPDSLSQPIHPLMPADRVIAWVTRRWKTR